MTITCLAGDMRSRSFSVLEQWMAELPRLLGEFRKFSDYTPFHDNETSAVSVLLAAAARAGYCPVSEYRLIKRGKDDLRHRRDGRADLWFGADGLGYSFEFKRCDHPNLVNLEWCMGEAWKDIVRVPRLEYDYAFAGLIAPLRDIANRGVYEQFNQHGLTFCLHESGHPAVYFYFQQYRS